MNKREKAETIFLYIVFIIYIVLLLKMLLFSRLIPADLFTGTVERSINLIPFSTIKGFLIGGSSLAFGNVAGNIALFIPLGAFLPFFKKDKRILTNLLIVTAASLAAETIQGLLGIGTADVDDVILNGLGGFIGILGYKTLSKLLRDGKKLRTLFVILSAIGLPILLYLLFVMQMRF